MATYIPVTNLPIQFEDSSGLPLNGGSLEFYLAGTTTATDLFSDNAGTSIGTSIAINSLGFPESGGNTIFLFRDQSKAIKIVLKDSAGATLATMDNIPAVASFDATSSAKLDLITVTSAIDLDTIGTTASAALPLTGGTMTGDITMSGAFVNDSVTVDIIASTTQTQAGGIALLSTLNEVITVANANDAVTLPTAAAGRTVVITNSGANTLQIFPYTSDSIDGGSVDASVTLAAGYSQIFKSVDAVNWISLLPNDSAAAKYASMYEEGNTIAFGMNAAAEPHTYHTAAMADGGSSGWTFDVGGSGVPVAIASVADGVATGVDIEVTTTGNHGLAVGDIISQTNLSDAAYVGVFVVKAIISTTQYEVAAVYTATDTGTMDHAATLTADTGSAGTYTIDWSASATGATSNETFDYNFYLNATAITGSSCRHKFGTAGDVGSISATTPPFAVADGDKVSFVLTNDDSAGDITIRNNTLRLNELI